jgi:hypothetical protein
MVKGEKMKTETSAKESPKPEGPAKATPPVSDRDTVEVEYNGTGLWIIDYPGRERFALAPGEHAKFNIRDRYELHALLQVIKNVNTPKMNTQSYLMKGDVEPMKYRHRFKIVNGIENLPPVLQKLAYRGVSAPTTEERDAILALVPTYYQREEKLYKVQV